jgi:hypothetical protein
MPLMNANVSGSSTSGAGNGDHVGTAGQHSQVGLGSRTRLGQAGAAKGRLGRWAKVGALAGIGCAVLLGACQSFLNYLSLEAAFKPPPAAKVALQGTLRLWAGDMNFHISPPEDPKEIRRSLREALELIQRSNLDFVYLTPKIRARFYENPEEFERVRGSWLMVQQTLSSLNEPHPLLMMGAQYFDERSGSVSLLHVDIPKILTEVSRDELKTSPAAFLNLVALRGGILIINHPLATPLPVPVDTALRYASRDHSWRPMTRPGSEYPKDIIAANNIYDGMQAYSIPVSVWRDQYVLENPTKSLSDVETRLAQESVRKQRRLVAMGGSDSRGGIIRATTFIAAPERTPEALRRAILHGRVCVRSPTPCGLRVYADDQGGSAFGVGDALVAERTVQFRWGDDESGDLYRNGERLGTFEGTTTQAASRGECHIYQLYLNNGYSGPVYVNCPFAANVRP